MAIEYIVAQAGQNVLMKPFVDAAPRRVLLPVT
jgi:hypothetical protein